MSYKKLSDIALVRRGASPRPIDDPKYFGGEVGWVRISDVSTSGKYLRKTTQYVSPLGESMSVRVDRGDLIMSIAATVGKPIIVDMPACIHDGFVHIYNLRGITSEFLYYSLLYLEKTIVGLGQAGTQVNINSEIVRTIPLYVPSIDAQNKITSILSDLDTLIARTDALIIKNERMRTGLFHDLLTRGVDEQGHIRSEETHKFKDSPIGRVPLEWEVDTIDKITSLVGSGVTPTGGNAVYSKEGIVFLRSQNVYNDGLMLDDVAYISAAIDSRMARSRIQDFDVLLNITGASIGRCCFVPAGFPRANVNQHVCIIRQRKTSYSNSAFLAAVLASPIGQRQISAQNAGGNREGLNFQQIKAFLIPLPPIIEREVIIQKIIQADELVAQQRRSLDKLKTLKTGLMHDLLTPPQATTVPVSPQYAALSA